MGFFLHVYISIFCDQQFVVAIETSRSLSKLATSSKNWDSQGFVTYLNWDILWDWDPTINPIYYSRQSYDDRKNSGVSASKNSLMKKR